MTEISELDPDSLRIAAPAQPRGGGRLVRLGAGAVASRDDRKRRRRSPTNPGSPIDEVFLIVPVRRKDTHAPETLSSHLPFWYAKHAEEAARFYASIFPNCSGRPRA
jgi:hypothetical protein